MERVEVVNDPRTRLQVRPRCLKAKRIVSGCRRPAVENVPGQDVGDDHRPRGRRVERVQLVENGLQEFERVGVLRCLDDPENIPETRVPKRVFPQLAEVEARIVFRRGDRRRIRVGKGVGLGRGVRDAIVGCGHTPEVLDGLVEDLGGSERASECVG